MTSQYVVVLIPWMSLPNLDSINNFQSPFSLWHFIVLPGRPPSMEELADRLNVPLETIDDPTKQLLKNLTSQLATVARQAGDLSREEASIPPELRAQSSKVPPEPRGGGSHSHASPEQRDHSSSRYSQSSHGPNYSSFAAAATASSLSDSNNSQSVSTAQVTVDYSHGRARSVSASKDTVTSESILASLQTDINTSSSYGAGKKSDVSIYSSSQVPLKDKVLGYSQHVRTEMSSSRAAQSGDHASASGNGFLPRQLKHQHPRHSTVTSGQINAQHQLRNQSTGQLGSRPGMNSQPNQSHRPSMGRNW